MAETGPGRIRGRIRRRIFGFSPNVFFLGVVSFLTDISGVDGRDLGWAPRFRVSYHLLAPAEGLRLRVQADTAEKDGTPELPTAASLWEMADWNEREVWDLMGIRCAGHPDLRRILLHEDYELGHPLQKQVPTRGVNDDNR